MVCRYHIGKVLGAGSFGIVREATEKVTNRRFACKTIPKIPKRGLCTPRYLLKLQTEVDVMQQLGASLDSVHLQVRTEGHTLCTRQASMDFPQRLEQQL